MTNKNILVTGGAGAIGSNLVKLLIKDKYEVTVLDDLSSGRISNIPAQVKFIHGSITNKKMVNTIFNQIRPSKVVHLAALFANQNSVDHPTLDLKVNSVGTLNILEAARTNNVSKIVYTSSSCVYGNNLGELKETMHNKDLDTPYAISKLTGEHYCNYYRKFYGIQVTILRLFNSFGPGEYPGKYRNVIPNFFKTALEGKPLPIYGDGEDTRDFNYVGNTVSGIMKAINYTGDQNHIFNIGSGKQTKIIDLAKRINTLTGNKAGVTFTPRREWDKINKRLACINLAKKELGYEPEISFSEGLEKTYKWIKTHV